MGVEILSFGRFGGLVRALVWIGMVAGASWRAHGQWSVVRNEPMAGAAGLEVRRVGLRSGEESAEVHVVRWNPRRHTLAVMDNPDGLLNLRSAAMKRGALAAVNGGYFHPDRTPLGLVVWKGAEVHPLEKARLLSGLVVVRQGRVALQRTGEFKGVVGVSDALQAGPFLVDAGKAVVGLEGTREAVRTVVFLDRDGVCGLAMCRRATLAETAQILLVPGMVGEAAVVRALNLDGGTSSGLWVGGEPGLYYPEVKGVRNYIAVVPLVR